MVRTLSLNNGKTIPFLAWGNMGSKEKAVQAGSAALKAGIHHIDSAQVYGTEAQVPEAIKAADMKREDVFVTTKLINLPQTQASAKDVKAAVQKSLDEFKFIPDLLLIHNPYIPGKAGIALPEFWKLLEALVEDGTLKGCSLGVSNFRPVDIEEVIKVAKIKPVVNQIECHPYVLTHLDPLMETHTKHSIVTQAYASLVPVTRHPTGGPLKPILADLAAKLSSESGVQVDEAGVLILWTYAKGMVCITSSSDEDRVRRMGATEQVRDLTADEVKQIDESGRRIHFRQWTEHMMNEYPDPDLPADV